MSHSTPAYPLHPRLAVGAVVFKEEKILLVKRGHSPGKGQWAIPGGNVNLGESLQAAAQREILEETGIVIEASDPVYTFDIIVKDADGRIKFHYVCVDLKAEYVSGEPRPGDDAADVRWVAAEQLDEMRVSPATLEMLRDHLNYNAQ